MITEFLNICLQLLTNDQQHSSTFFTTLSTKLTKKQPWWFFCLVLKQSSFKFLSSFSLIYVCVSHEWTAQTDEIIISMISRRRRLRFFARRRIGWKRRATTTHHGIRFGESANVVLTAYGLADAGNVDFGDGARVQARRPHGSRWFGRC